MKASTSNHTKTSKYLIHSFIIESAFDLHPLKPIDYPALSSKKIDITIFNTSIKHIDDRFFFENPASTNDCWIDIPNIAKFHVKNGNSIEIDPYSTAPMQSVLLYLFGSIMALCFYQRGLLVLHANAIEINDSVVLFAGESGAGKSTTAAIFHQKGFNVLSDDIVVLNEDAHAMGGFPQIKLFKKTLNELNISSENLTPIAAQKGKFSFPLSQENIQKKRRIKAIYVLSEATSNSDIEFGFSPIQGLQRFKTLIEHTYRNELIEGLNLQDHHLNLCANLSNNLHMTNIIRPTTYFNGYELVNTIIEDLKKMGVLNSSFQ